MMMIVLCLLCFKFGVLVVIVIVVHGSSRRAVTELWEINLLLWSAPSKLHHFGAIECPPRSGALLIWVSYFYARADIEICFIPLHHSLAQSLAEREDLRSGLSLWLLIYADSVIYVFDISPCAPIPSARNPLLPELSDAASCISQCFDDDVDLKRNPQQEKKIS